MNHMPFPLSFRSFPWSYKSFVPKKDEKRSLVGFYTLERISRPLLRMNETFYKKIRKKNS